MKRWMKWSLGLVVLVVIMLTGVGLYFYKYAIVPGQKDFVAGTPDIGSRNSYHEKNWFSDVKSQGWRIKSKDGLSLYAGYFPAAKKTDKTVILAHGYNSNHNEMKSYAKIYHKQGYNVLAPDARAHGQSDGKSIGFGWPERRDYIQWIKEILKKNGTDTKIVLHGVSMGAATVMMTSGEKDLPKNVKAVIEDCGYTSVKDELSYQLKQMFDLPAFPIMSVTSGITKIRAGYFFGEADALKQIKKADIPMLFIHGDQDKFVPSKMVHTLYDAYSGPKKIVIFKGAAHAESLKKDYKLYEQSVRDFLNQYVKS